MFCKKKGGNLFFFRHTYMVETKKLRLRIILI